MSQNDQNVSRNVKILFPFSQIRIDKLVDKWSGSIEIGVTTHNPNNLDYPATMTNLRSGNTHTVCEQTVLNR